jgi:hypothetical protein
VCAPPAATLAKLLLIVATQTSAVPEWRSTVAVMVAEPTAAALTNPDEETAATAELELDHSTVRPARKFWSVS